MIIETLKSGGFVVTFSRVKDARDVASCLERKYGVIRIGYSTYSKQVWFHPGTTIEITPAMREEVMKDIDSIVYYEERKKSHV